jgi:hypothetical protein
LMMTLGSPPSITETTEFVVPRSIPIAFVIENHLSFSLLINIGTVFFMSRKANVFLLLTKLPDMLCCIVSECSFI